MTVEKIHPAFAAACAVDRCAFFAARRAGARRDAEACARRFAADFPFRLAFSASIRLTTLSGFSSRSAALIGLPEALRRTRRLQRVLVFVLELRGIEMRGLGLQDVARGVRPCPR